MFTSLDAFFQTWQHESANTQKLMDTLTDASLNQEVSPQDRTLGRIAWHIVCSVHEMMSRTGLEFDAPEEGESAPASAKVIQDGYRQANESFVAALKSQWSDATLMQVVDMYGEQWPNGLTLSILLAHQTHHRGQMTVLMRQAGLKVPGMIGPAREEWSLMGMEAPAI